MPADVLSAAQARRLAVAAQGLGRPRAPGPVGIRQVRAVAERIGALQIDSVNVLARAHLLPLYSRLGNYDVSLLSRLAYTAPRRLHESWAHVAAYAPVDLEPMLRWRQAAHRERYARKPISDSLVAEITAQGPMAASDFESRSGGSSWWNWSDSKLALEVMFLRGELAVARRRNNFEREYDLPERVLPPAVFNAPDVPALEARRVLLLRAAALLGVGTYADLCDVFRLKATATRPALEGLVAAGELIRVEVESWGEAGYVLPSTVVPRTVTGAALVAPFDPLVWHRERVERLWGMRLRIEIYTPAPQRVYGYYVLPFLVGDSVVARIDLKADRAAGVLRVIACHGEPGIDPGLVGTALGAELQLLAEWLGLSAIEVRPRGDLAPFVPVG